MYSDRRGMDKTPPRQNLPNKRPLDNNPRKQWRENLYRGLLAGFFVLGLLKIGGGVQDVGRTLLGWSGMCDRGLEGSKLAKNSMTYFMDSPKNTIMECGAV